RMRIVTVNTSGLGRRSPWRRLIHRNTRQDQAPVFDCLLRANGAAVLHYRCRRDDPVGSARWSRLTTFDRFRPHRLNSYAIGNETFAGSSEERPRAVDGIA